MQLTIQDDFDLQKIAESGQCFRVEPFGNGWYRFITKRNVLYIRSVGEGVFDVSCTQEQWDNVWVPYFHLQKNYADVRAAIPSTDPYLQRAAQHGQGIRILRQDPWEMLVTFIISQRKSIPAIKNAVETLAARYGVPIVTEREIVYAFPTAEQLYAASREELAQCKLGYRVPYVQHAAQVVHTGALQLNALNNCPDDELLQQLKRVHGVGEKVANCVALFAYGRTALAPVDTWIQKIIAQEYNGQNPFPAYAQAAGIMQQYAFYYALTNKHELR
jgi:N-glycosylase/DNA lyase